MFKNTYIRDVDGTELYEYDHVLYEVERNSSSHGSWGRVTNQHHGKYRIHGTIKFVDGKFVIEGNGYEIKQLEKPKGKEIFEQNVWFAVQELAGAAWVKKIPEGDPVDRQPLDRYSILLEDSTGV